MNRSQLLRSVQGSNIQPFFSREGIATDVVYPLAEGVRLPNSRWLSLAQTSIEACLFCGQESTHADKPVSFQTICIKCLLHGTLLCWDGIGTPRIESLLLTVRAEQHAARR